MHDIIGHYAVSIRSWDQERSYNDKAIITSDMLIHEREGSNSTLAIQKRKLRCRIEASETLPFPLIT
ncbi:hypothetical protein BHM03_00013566 [Ensete ventricosum]|nr:hypothetical protein BHM03_00013566 [Ensete ventricosum]